jgi:hypothetical protein
MFWIAGDLGGEAAMSQLLVLSVRADTAIVARADLTRMEEWGWLKGGMVHFETEESLKLYEQDGKWTTGRAPWYLQDPGRDEDLVSAFDAHCGKYNGENLRAWARDEGERAIQRPRISKMKADLVYAYPAGLHTDCSISAAYYFPKSGYLLVFTKQERRTVGMGTMHGFLLLRRAE